MLQYLIFDLKKKREVKMNDHTFAICAYKESPYLEECVESLKNQEQQSNILMVTSTPNEYIKKISQKYNIEISLFLCKYEIYYYCPSG